jgi:SAM-dependent methyltransferase
VPAYALLVRPAANRVFGGDARRLLRSELLAIDRLRGGALAGVADLDLAGVPYVALDGDADLETIGALSSSFALFERTDEGTLRPVPLAGVERYDDDLVTIQRYVGKTNEALTRLLLNLALAAAGTRTGRVLDPLCGRGTTLNQALLLGNDALGIDLDAKDTAAYATFLTTWLQDKRIKHQTDRSAGRHRFRVTIGRKGETSQTVDVVTGDTTEAPARFGRNAVDAIVTDLPYGVQHGAASSASRLSRRPDELLAAALPAWRTTLRPGGGMAVSWNTKVLPRADLLAALADTGYEVPDLGADVDFSHRVDRVITRDVVVARRPR